MCDKSEFTQELYTMSCCGSYISFIVKNTVQKFTEHRPETMNDGIKKVPPDTNIYVD